MLEIKKNIQEMTKNILQVAQEISIKNIPNKVSYVIHLLDNELQNSSLDEIKQQRKSIVYSTYKKNIDELIVEIYKHKKNIHWINMLLFSSSDEENIILVELVLKQKDAFFAKKQNIEYHAEILLPPFHKQGEKININWHL